VLIEGDAAHQGMFEFDIKPKPLLESLYHCFGCGQYFRANAIPGKNKNFMGHRDSNAVEKVAKDTGKARFVVQCGIKNFSQTA